MMIKLLSIACISFWTCGACLSVLITGWELNKVSDLFKTIFWPIFIFTER